MKEQKYCKHLKRNFKNGEIVSTSCNIKTVSVDEDFCSTCSGNTTLNKKKPFTVKIDRENKEPVSREELFIILQSSFSIITEELEKQLKDFDERLKVLEDK